MSSLKKNRTRVAFGDVVGLSNVRSKNPSADGFERYVGLEHLEPGDLKIRSWGDIADGTTFTSVFKQGQVLFGKRRAYQRKVAVADFSGVCSGDIYVLEPKGDDLLPELLPFICQTEAFFDHAVGTSAGSLSPRTNWKSLATFEFSLPPLAEQRRIAEVLQAADATGESTLRLIEQIRIVEASLFRKLIGAASTMPTPLGELIVKSPRNGCSAHPSTAPTGHWVLALSAISKWGYRAGELKPVEKTSEMEAAILMEGDLVLSRSNTRELVGLPAIFPESRDDVSYPDTMMRLTLDKSRVRTRFIEHFLRSQDGRRQVQSYAAGTSASMKKINGTNLKKVIVSLMSLQEQDSMQERLDQFQLARSCALDRLVSSALLKSRLLDEAIPGDQEQ